MKNTKILPTLLLSATFAHAQGTVVTDDIFISPKFFVAILAGVILALAFQFILTAISVAIGITAIGDIKQNYAEAQAATFGNKVNDEKEFDQDHGSGTNLGVKITSAFGLWSVITTSISLFGATALALNLNVLDSDAANITMALVIWALFYLLLFYLEARIVNTVLGGLIQTATSGLRASSNAVKQLFASSEERKVEHMVENTIDTVRKEFKGVDTSKISETLDNFLQRIDDKIPSYERLRNDLEYIANESKEKNTSGKWMAIQQILTKAIDEKSDNASADAKEKKENLMQLVKDLKASYDKEESVQGGLKNVVKDFTNAEQKDIDARMQQINKILERFTPESLKDGSLKNQLEAVMNHPQLLVALMGSKFKNLDRASIIKILTENTSLNKSEVEGYAVKVSAAMDSIAKEFDAENENRFTKRVEARIAEFLNSAEREELDYSVLKNELLHILDNPNEGLPIIKNRLAQFDGDTVRALITNNKHVKEDHINGLSKTITDAKNEVLNKVSEIESMANKRIQMVKRKAIIQAEHTRKTAASAAWWLVVSAGFSACAALLSTLVQ